MVVPTEPPGSGQGLNVQAFWPGIETFDQRNLIQNVVTNKGNESGGAWYLFPFYCCLYATNPIVSGIGLTLPLATMPRNQSLEA